MEGVKENVGDYRGRTRGGWTKMGRQPGVAAGGPEGSAVVVV